MWVKTLIEGGAPARVPAPRKGIILVSMSRQNNYRDKLRDVVCTMATSWHRQALWGERPKHLYARREPSFEQRDSPTGHQGEKNERL